MYVLIVSDAPALPVDICIASAMLGHAAWAFRPEELEAGSETRPSLVLLDLEDTADLAGSVARVRQRYRDVPIAVLTADGESIESLEQAFFRLPKPVTASALREVMQLASLAA